MLCISTSFWVLEYLKAGPNGCMYKAPNLSIVLKRQRLKAETGRPNKQKSEGQKFDHMPKIYIQEIIRLYITLYNVKDSRS